MVRAIGRACGYLLVGCTVIAGSAGSALAQGYALRGGANINPDQLSVGGQYELGPVAERLWLQPNADVGFGNDATLVAFNFDVMYRRPLSRASIWTGYAGGGPAINWYKLLGYSQTGAGANLVGGVMHHTGLFTEVRLGFLESPRLRFGVGYTFGRNKAAPRRPTPPRRK